MAPRRRPGPPEAKSWGHALTQQVGRNLEAYRRERGMQILELGEACAALGYSVGRMSISSLEAGTRESVPLAEVVALAAALDLAPVDLIFRATSATIELPPGERSAMDAASAWFAFHSPKGPASSDFRTLQRHYVSVATLVEDWRALNNHREAAREGDGFSYTDPETTRSVVRNATKEVLLLAQLREGLAVRDRVAPELPDFLAGIDEPTGPERVIGRFTDLTEETEAIIEASKVHTRLLEHSDDVGQGAGQRGER